MKRITTILLILWSITLTLWTIKQCTTSKREDSQIVVIPDTIYLPARKFQKLEPLPKVDLPKRVIFYRNPESGTVEYEDSAKVTDSDKDSLSSFNLNQGNLRLDFLNPDSKNSTTKVYKLDLDNNQYTFTNGTLTHKKINFYEKKDFVKPYIYLQYRPIHGFWDTGGGISFKTTRSNYQIGINSYYYPSLNQKGLDLEIRLQYNF